MIIDNANGAVEVEAIEEETVLEVDLDNAGEYADGPFDRVAIDDQIYSEPSPPSSPTPPPKKYFFLELNGLS